MVPAGDVKRKRLAGNLLLGETHSSGTCGMLQGAQLAAISAVAVDYFEMALYQSWPDGL